MSQQNPQQNQTPEFGHYHITSLLYGGASSVIPGALNFRYPDGETAYFRSQEAHKNELDKFLSPGEPCVVKVTPARVIFSVLLNQGEFISGNPIFAEYVEKPAAKPAA